MKNLMLLLIGLAAFSSSFAQDKKAKYETVVIQTSAQCDDCKERIEDGLNYTKGVKFAELDLETKKVTVKYSPTKISIKEIKDKLNEIGYDADDQKAKEENVKKLPLCCQPGGMEKH
jgi:copper chaperone CopZ